MADKILVEVEGVEPFECDEDFYNLSMMIVELLRDALQETQGKPKIDSSSALVNALKAELSKLQRPRILKTELSMSRDWRGELQGVTMTHHYEDGTEETMH